MKTISKLRLRANRSRGIIFVLALSLLALGAVPAGAALSESDCNGLRSMGDCTFDDVSNLHWLDWTLSTELSFNDVVDMHLAGQFDGFRHATFAELNAFLLSAGVDLDPVGTSPADPNLRALQQLLGVTDTISATESTAMFLGSCFQPCSNEIPTLSLKSFGDALSFTQTKHSVLSNCA